MLCYGHHNCHFVRGTISNKGNNTEAISCHSTLIPRVWSPTPFLRFSRSLGISSRKHRLDLSKEHFYVVIKPSSGIFCCWIPLECAQGVIFVGKMENLHLRRPFDPVAHDLDGSFRLTKHSDLKGCGCRVPHVVLGRLLGDLFTEPVNEDEQNFNSMFMEPKVQRLGMVYFCKTVKTWVVNYLLNAVICIELNVSMSGYTASAILTVLLGLV